MHFVENSHVVAEEMDECRGEDVGVEIELEEVECKVRKVVVHVSRTDIRGIGDLVLLRLRQIVDIRYSAEKYI